MTYGTREFLKDRNVDNFCFAFKGKFGVEWLK